MDQKTTNAWLVFLAALALGVQVVGTWFQYQQLQIARQAS